MLISQPTFIFPTKSKKHSSFDIIIGVTIGLLGAVCSANVAVLIKKLSNLKTHYSVIGLFGSYCGLPISLIIAIVFHFTGQNKRSQEYKDQSLEWLLFQFSYLFLSSFFVVMTEILMNISLKYDDASKVTIIRSTDLVFIFVLQYIFLDIKPNIFNSLGALLIFIGAILIMIYKIFIDVKHPDSKNLSLIKRILYFKL